MSTNTEAPAQLKDVAASVRLANGNQNKDCFRNALFACKAGWKYVEGYAVDCDMRILVCHHGWLLNSDGEIVDPTPVWATKSAKYFPVDIYERADAMARTVKKGMLPLDGDMHLNKRWREQYLNATEYAMGKEGRAFLEDTWAKNHKRHA